MAKPILLFFQHRTFDRYPGIGAIDLDSKTERLAGASVKNQVSVLYTNPKKRSLFLVGHQDKVLDVNFNQDGTLIASGGKDRSLIVYDSPTEVCSTRSTSFNCHFGEIHSVEFSNDSEYILTGSSDKMIRIVSVHKEKQVTNFLKHKNWVRCARYAKSNQNFLSGGDGGMIYLWDVRRQGVINSAPMGNPVIKVATDTSDRHFAGVTRKGISIFDAKICKRVQHYVPQETHEYVTAHFHPSMPWILMAQANGYVCITDLVSGESILQNSDLLQSLFEAKFSRCGKYFIIAGKNFQGQVQAFLLEWAAKDPLSSAPKSRKPSSRKRILKPLQHSVKSTVSLEKVKSKGNCIIDEMGNYICTSTNVTSSFGSIRTSKKPTSSFESIGSSINSTYSSTNPIAPAKISTLSFDSVAPSISSDGSKIPEFNLNLEQMSRISNHLPFGSVSYEAGYSLLGLAKLTDAKYPFNDSKDVDAIWQPIKSDIGKEQCIPSSNVPCDSHQSKPDLLTENVNSQLSELESPPFAEGHASARQIDRSDEALVEELDDAWMKCCHTFQKLRNNERNIAAMSTSLISKLTKSTYLEKHSSTASLRNFKNWLVELEGVLSVHNKEMIKLEAELRYECNKTDQ